MPKVVGRFGALLADRAYDAQERVVDVLNAAGVEVVIPSKINDHLTESCLNHKMASSPPKKDASDTEHKRASADPSVRIPTRSYRRP